MTYRQLPRCGAYARSADRPCRHVALANGRCYYHGGKSAGPRTAKGKMLCKQARVTHGKYTKEKITERKEFRGQLKEMRLALNEIIENI